jgi:GntR family transcriptional regulator
MRDFMNKKKNDKLAGSPLPRYFQVAGLIRDGIFAGTWPAGSRLPTENEMARNYGVSRPTIRNAKEILAEQGFIRSIKGSGCYVNGQKTWKTQPPTVENLNDIFHYGSQMSFKIHEFGMVANTEEIINKLKNPQDQFVFQIRGIRWFQGQPLSYVVYYLPYRFGSRIPLESLDGNPFIPQFEKLAGVHIVEGIQNISLGRADTIVAEHLKLKKGQSVLVVKTVYFDEKQHPIEYVETKYPDALPYFIRVKRN